MITTTFEDLERMGHSSVTDYCRELMALNAERYGEMSLEVRRGEMVCLHVRKVQEAAELEPTGTTWRKVRPIRLSKARG